MKLKFNPSRILQICFAAFVISIPLFSTLFLVRFFLHKHLLNFIPQWSDEVFYWHQVATFKVANFNGGYYTTNELPAPASFAHFYSEGFIYPFLTGLLAKILGWKYYSAPLLNIALFTLAITWLAFTIKPNFIQLFLIGSVLLTFWPVQIYMATNMIVVFSCTFSVILAVFFYKTIQNPEETSPAYYAIFLFIICLATILKVSWSILFIPYLLIIRRKFHLSIFQVVLASIVLTVISFLVYGWLSAPFPEWFTSKLLATVQISLFDTIRMVVNHSVANLRNFFDFSQNPLFLMVRLEMLVVILFSAYLLWKQRKDDSLVRESSVVIINCFLLMVETILFFDVYDWRDFRLFAPVLLMIILIFIERKRTAIVCLLVIVNLAFLPSFRSSYRELLTNSFPNSSNAIGKFSNEISPVVKYDKSKSAWDNTLLIPVAYLFDNRLLGIPAGIGITWFDSADSLTQIKSRYLLLDDKNYEILKNRACLQFIQKTDKGNLYINLGADCTK